MMLTRLMKNCLPAALLFSILAQSIGTASVPSATNQFPKQNYMMVSLADGVTSEAVKSLTARITIDAPPVYVWQTLTSYNKLKEFMPGYKKTDLVSEDGTGKILEVAMNPSRLLPPYNYRLRIHENKKSYVLNFRQISGDFNYLSASYQMLPKGNGSQTVLVYNLKIDPGNRLPQLGMNTILKNNAEKTLKAIQTRSETEHKKSLIGQR